MPAAPGQYRKVSILDCLRGWFFTGRFFTQKVWGSGWWVVDSGWWAVVSEGAPLARFYLCGGAGFPPTATLPPLGGGGHVGCSLLAVLSPQSSESTTHQPS